MAFPPRYLGRLERDEALALVRQTQSPAPPSVPDSVAETCWPPPTGTVSHPMAVRPAVDRWTLRAPTADDLIPDLNLVNLFQLDYNYLAPVERRILRCLSSSDRSTKPG